jgi:hypothetical protein
MKHAARIAQRAACTVYRYSTRHCRTQVAARNAVLIEPTEAVGQTLRQFGSLGGEE